MNANDISGKLVLVTGASTGIGAAVAKAFAAEGAKVAVHYNANAEAANEVKLAITAAGGTCVLVQGDLTAEGEPGRIVAEAARQLGHMPAGPNSVRTYGLVPPASRYRLGIEGPPP